MGREIDIRQRALAQLRNHAHQLVAAGYGRLTPATYANWKEPDITGELCKAMTEFMAADNAPRWVERYSLRDDPKIDVMGKHGESRPRIDIEFERVQRGERPKFRFEAKRLGSNHPLSKYLGSEGMGAFLGGYYSLTHPEAGMLGYFQKEEFGYWQDQLGSAFSKQGAFRLKSVGWKSVSLVPELSTWRTEHVTESGRSLTIWHSILQFW